MQRMESEPNALLAALGGYDSEDSDSNSRHSSNSEAIYPQPPPIDDNVEEEYGGANNQFSSADEAEVDYESSDDAKCNASPSYISAEADARTCESDLIAYEKTKRDMDL
ncbi:hypothetical protein GGF41_001100, partial [Coemansia sp. RSA 2531]